MDVPAFLLAAAAPLLFLKFLETRKKLYLILIGFLLGMSFMFHIYETVFIGFILALIFSALVWLKEMDLKKAILSLTLIVLIIFLVTAPYLTIFLNNYPLGGKASTFFDYSKENVDILLSWFDLLKG